MSSRVGKNSFQNGNEVANSLDLHVGLANDKNLGHN
jgi:hypothetical protein